MSYEKIALLTCVVIVAGIVGGAIAASIGHWGQK